MTLTKTLQNINKTKNGFFNIENCFLNLDLIKVGLCFNYQNGMCIIVNNYIKDKQYLNIGSSTCLKLGLGNTYFFRNKLIKGYMGLSYQMFIGNYELAKNNF